MISKRKNEKNDNLVEKLKYSISFHCSFCIFLIASAYRKHNNLNSEASFNGKQGKCAKLC